MIGRTLSHYEITELLGKGGMGEVYLATDKNLDRKAAIKILPEALAADSEREARFEREAKLLASLSHPNIAGIYGLHVDGSPHFLAMEYVPGEDLAQILQRGAIATEDAVQISLQIAAALEFAHEHGIVHRDLKPANVRITPERKTKVLDFGLGKFMESDPEVQDLHNSPTLTAGHTRVGVVLGTAAYMSPEQARGAVVDRRADIWAFGCVLFEMLSGRRAFQGETVTDTFVSVLSHEPDWSALPASTPSALRRLLTRCLDKDPLRRLRDIGEARVTLEDVAVGKTAATPAAKDMPRQRRLQGVLGGILFGAVLFAAGYLLRPPGSSETAGISHDVHLRRLSYSDGLAHEPSLSSDGNYVAYTSDEDGNLDISVLPLAGGNINRVVEHPADDAQPRWSPDGSKLAFVSGRDREGRLSVIGGLGVLSASVRGNGGDIFLMPAMGGHATKLTGPGCYPNWSPDGASICFQSDRSGNWDIWSIPASGGQAAQLTDDSEPDYQPAWSPDGRWIAFGAQSPYRLCVMPSRGGEKIDLYEGRILTPAWSPDGNWLYFSSDRASAPGDMDLWRIPFDPHGGLVPEPQRVTVADAKEVGAVVSADGECLVFGELRETPDIWRLDMASRAVEQVSSAASSDNFPHLSPDDRKVLFTSDRSGEERLWTLDVENRTLLQVETPGEASASRWSPDGSQIAYQASGQSGDELLLMRVGAIQAQPIAVADVSNPVWSNDGKKIASYGSGIVLHDLESGTHTRLREDSESSFPTFSPDGRTIAYQQGSLGDRRELWAISVDGGEPWLIAGGEVEYSHPQWNPKDADQILIVVDHEELAIVHVSSGEVEFVTSFGSSTVDVDYPSWSYDGQFVYFSVIRRSGDLYMLEGL